MGLLLRVDVHRDLLCRRAPFPRVSKLNFQVLAFLEQAVAVLSQVVALILHLEQPLAELVGIQLGASLMEATRIAYLLHSKPLQWICANLNEVGILLHLRRITVQHIPWDSLESIWGAA